MEREIKFRGLRVTGSGFIYGNLIIDSSSNKTYINSNQVYKNNISVDCANVYEVLPESVGQFTGVLNIFEGDLIDSYQNDYQPTEVFWDNDLGQWSTQNYHSTLSLSGSSDNKTKILGNIYQNKDLL